ncbi:MFS transporter [Mycolicibacterium neworleansense]|uniref:EmrB/QacA family drug resistance transporter n=1 Tax=Mycolicibacterium neworleansense TaxID=146018 RepID=A0A0H5RLE8_9MYCO|nr:MFS transporter [Mycolicibacterium neworleansense]MCV7360436.1 MFS transporter [Mycolicibacterium neworleansense]CRZ14606.1 EmrB/QacA family drug resistance transporter [Mycolicibacterium neworleansense]
MKPSLCAVAASLYLTEYTLYSNSSSAVLLNSAIADHFGIPFSAAAYIGVAFLAGFCLALLPAGLLSHRYPPAALFFAGSAVLAVLGIAAALSPQFWVLIALRFLQGIASAVVAPQIFRIIRAQFYPDHHSAVLGAWGLVVSASALFSPLITALLNDLWGWRSFPYETVVTTLAAMVLLTLAPARPDTAEEAAMTGRAAIPVVGLAAVQLAIFLAIGSSSGPGTKVALLVVAIALGLAVIVLRSRSQSHVLSGSLVVIFVAGIATNVFTLSVVYAVQQLRGLDSYASALFLLPMALLAGLIPMLRFGRPGDNRKSTRLVCVGAAFLIVAGLSLPAQLLLVSAALMGAAMGFLWSALAANVLTNSTDIPFDSSLYYYLRALGAAIGVATGATMIDGLGTALFGGAAVLVTVAGLTAVTAARSAWRATHLVQVR